MIANNYQTVLLDCWGVVVEQEKGGKVMTDAYRLEAKNQGIPNNTIDTAVNDYNLVLQNDKSVADRKTEIVNDLQDLAEKYIAESDDETIDQDLEASIYNDARSTITRAVNEGYNIAIYSTRPVEWIRKYLEVELGEIYAAPDGKTTAEFNGICKKEAAKGNTVVSFTEDAGKALKAAQKSDYVINSLIYINRGDDGLSREECEELGIVYTENLEDVYEHMVGEQQTEEEGEPDDVD